jgi:putative aminopeptidase FrvX
MKKLTKQLFKLLSLHSPSGKESRVARYLLPLLKGTMDSVNVDAYGNIYAERKYGDSDYTVLLSAHMDTVAYEQPIPTWRNNKTEIYTQSKSALGGDDKCGIAVHLAVIRALNEFTKFNGTVKILFSREEEIGCVGAYNAVQVNPLWFDDIDCSIVVDRKGNDNIVNGSWGENFCSEDYSQFWVDMAERIGFEGIPQDGSISDTMVFSEIGINGVNLSAGYYNAHTREEYIKIAEVKRTAQWIITAFDNIEEYGKFPKFEYVDKKNGFGGYGDFYHFRDTMSNEKMVFCDSCYIGVDVNDTIEDTNGLIVCHDCYYVYCDNCDDHIALGEEIIIKGSHTLCQSCASQMHEANEI